MDPTPIDEFALPPAASASMTPAEPHTPASRPRTPRMPRTPATAPAPATAPLYHRPAAPPENPRRPTPRPARRPRVTNRHKSLFFGVMIRNERVYAAMRDGLLAETMAGFDAGIGVMMRAVNTHYDAHGALPNREILAGNIEAAMAENPNLLNDPEAANLSELIDMAYDPQTYGSGQPADAANTAWALGIGRKILEEKLAAEIHESLAPETVAADLSAMLDHLRERAGRIAMLGGAVGRTAADICRDPSLTDEEPEMIAGLLRRHEFGTMNFATKMGKSWIVLALALACAAGKSWLGCAVTPGRVLLIDGELRWKTMVKRLNMLAAYMGIDAATALPRITILAEEMSPADVAGIAAAARSTPWDMLLIDPIYTFYGPGKSESRDEDTREMYMGLRQIARNGTGAVVAIHHGTKGLQGDKRVTDVGSGHGNISRAPDAHIIIRPTDESEAYPLAATLEAAGRTTLPFPPADLMRTRELPLWVPAVTAGGEKIDLVEKRFDDMDTAILLSCTRPAPGTSAHYIIETAQAKFGAKATLRGVKVVIERLCDAGRLTSRKTGHATMYSRPEAASDRVGMR